MAQYRYLFADLLTGAMLAELPLSGVKFGFMLNSAGSFSATLPLGDPKITALDWADALQESRTAVYIDRDGALLWGGILWTHHRSKSGSAIQISGKEFWSYFDRRYVTSAVAWTSTDQLTIAESLINTAQAKRNGNVGIVVPSTTCGVNRQLTITVDQFLVVSQAVQNLAALDNGFDFAVDVSYDSTVTPQKQLTLNYPRRGRTATNSGLVFALPGNIIDYDWPQDGTTLTTTAYALGSGTGKAMLRSSASDTSLLNAGYPLLETATPYKTVTEQGRLDAHAKSDVALLSQPVVTATLQVRADADPVLGSYIVGDEARISIQDEQFPNGLDANYRIVAMSVTPNDGTTHESVQLTLGPTV